MKIGAIVLLIAVFGFFIFETVSLVMTIVKKKKEKSATDKKTESEVENNNEKEV